VLTTTPYPLPVEVLACRLPQPLLPEATPAAARTRANSG